jgi:hypothetical protein
MVNTDGFITNEMRLTDRLAIDGNRKHCTEVSSVHCEHFNELLVNCTSTVKFRIANRRSV